MAAGGLRNEDFRKLLATPRPGAGGGGGGGGGGSGEGDKQKKGKKPGRNYRPGGKPGAQEGEEDDGPKYRDRAAERRKGLSTEFEGVPDDLVGLLEGKGDLRNVSYEDSKYLGGDVAHTHLVKGLDFALLHKVRAEQEASKRTGTGDESDEEEAPALAKPVPLPGAAVAQQATFITPLGRAVHSFFFDPKQRGVGVPVHELFLPKRTAFVYELEDPDAPDVPTTLRRSKEDCPKVKEMAMGGLDSSVLDRIAKIMSYMTVAGGGRKKLKKREREALLQQHGIALAGQLKGQGAEGQIGKDSAGAAGADGGSGPASQEGGAAAAADAAAPPLPPPPADDDDIFGDVGTDYEPTIKDKERMQQKAAAAEEAGRRGGYFGGEDDLHADLPPLPKEDDGVPPPPPPEDGEILDAAAGPARPPAGYDAAAAYGAYPEPDSAAAQQAAAEAVREEKAKGKRQAAELLASAGGDDAYAECYPSYYDYGTMMEDSDEEGGAPLQQQALTRRDFASEADWQEYQATGMAPRQLEGRAKVRQQQKDASKEKSKIATQLGKIQKIMEDKGYDHTSAFTKPRRERGEGGEGGGEGGAPAAAFTKKRRI